MPREAVAKSPRRTATEVAHIYLILALAIFMAAWSFLALRRPPHHVKSTNDTHSITVVTPRVAEHHEINPITGGNVVTNAQSFLPMPLLFDRTLSPSEKSESIGIDFIDAILRIEGIFDPTRIGFFGPSLRMQIRPGTMSMNNVFADQWMTVSQDPNIHYRTARFAETWLWPLQRDCDGFQRFRPDDLGILLDRLSAADCEAIWHPTDAYSPIVSASLSMPVFAAPYPGNRLSSDDFIRAQEAHVRAIRERLKLRMLNPA